MLKTSFPMKATPELVCDFLSSINVHTLLRDVMSSSASINSCKINQAIRAQRQNRIIYQIDCRSVMFPREESQKTKRISGCEIIIFK